MPYLLQLVSPNDSAKVRIIFRPANFLHKSFHSADKAIHCVSVVRFWKILNFVVSRDVTPLTLHICESVFRKSLIENVEVFLIRRAIRNNTHFRIDNCGWGVLRLRYPISIRVWVLCRLFLIRSFHNLQSDKRKSAPHFLCIWPLNSLTELQILVEYQ